VNAAPLTATVSHIFVRQPAHSKTARY